MKKICVITLTLFLLVISFAASAQQSGREDIFTHTIERGQTVYSIATMYGVTTDDIYQLNPGSKTGIKAGDILRIPQHKPVSGVAAENLYTYHTIEPKETLYSLTIRYGVPASAIVEANPGLSTATFTIGKTIRIPNQQLITTVEEQPVTIVQTTQNLVDYKIAKKETLYRICKKFNISSNELIDLNPKLKEGVKAGMVIKVPVQTETLVTTEAASVASERDINALLSAQKNAQHVRAIKVAILLPFMTNEVVTSSGSARFIEYYEGFLLAVEQLRNEGVSVDLSVFDIGEGTSQLKQILRDPELKSMNLLIGAVQNDQIALVSDFARENQINYVIPFTSRNDDVLSNAYIYQVNTPHSHLYAKASQAGADLFGNDNIILVNTPDKDEKADFITSFKSELGQRLIPYKELDYNNETFTTDLENLMDSTRRNVVLPTSSSLEALNKIRTPVRLLADRFPENQFTLFGYPDWQTYTRDCLDDLFALDTYIYSNFYADNLSNDVTDFYTNYKKWYSKNLINSFPKYGILGYDTGMFFLTAIDKYGTDFGNQLNRMNYKRSQTGFDFQRVNNWGGFVNTNIFIVHYGKNFNVTRTEIK